MYVLDIHCHYVVFKHVYLNVGVVLGFSVAWFHKSMPAFQGACCLHLQSLSVKAGT